MRSPRPGQPITARVIEMNLGADQSDPNSVVAQMQRWWLVVGPCLLVDGSPFSGELDDGSWSQKVPFDLLITMVRYICDESWIVSTHFCAEMIKFVSGFEPNGALFWGNDLEFLLVAKNSFQLYIICLCVNLQLKYYLVLRVGPTGTWNQDLRSLPDLFQHHKSNGYPKFDKRASVENHIFRC